MVNSKRVYAKGDFPSLMLPIPQPCGEPLPVHASTGDPPTLEVVLVLSSVESLLLSYGSCCMQDFVCTLRDWSLCFPQSCESPIIKSHWPSKPDSLGIPRMGSLTWGSEPTQQWENFFGIIFLKFVACLSGGYRIWFYHYFSPPTISLWLLLCLLM